MISLDKLCNSGLLKVKTHQKLSFTKLLTTRASDKSKIVFFPGCSLVDNNPSLVVKAYDYLKDIYNDIEMIAMCCGKPAQSTKNAKIITKYQDEVIKGINNANTIITACPNCYNYLSNFLDTKIITIWDIFCSAGVPIKDKFLESNKVFTIHDPCPTKNNHKLHTTIRNICSQLGLSIIESKTSRQSTSCCGAINMQKLFNPLLFSKIRQKRLDTLACNLCITYCQECANVLQDTTIKTYHLLDLILTDMVDNCNDLSSLDKWFNRYKFKKIVVKLKDD
ncbi:(Fe-S)-binding protein [Clostridiaceae bacterium M8S5]|nr:(Fe-S)-binding protein [Clostridiaceae bacterium M8S5]